MTTVLICDDSPIVCEAASCVLTEAGFDVSVRTTAIALSGVVRAKKPDLVVLDVEMPGLTGVDACARIRKASPTSRVLLFSSVSHLEELSRMCAADDWLHKQKGLDALVSKVRELASAHRRIGVSKP